MFRPNRIGTPIIHVDLDDASGATFTPNTNANVISTVEGNVINASPQLDFGYNAVSWFAAARVIPAAEKWGVVQQFTVTEPLAGDTVGVEVNGSIDIATEDGATIVPVFFKAANVAGALWGDIASNEPATRLGNGLQANGVSTNSVMRTLNYQRQIVVRGTPGLIAGNYAHGFLIYNNKSGATLDIVAFHMQASLRQLNDQQNIGYRDTLR